MDCMTRDIAMADTTIVADAPEMTAHAMTCAGISDSEAVAKHRPWVKKLALRYAGARNRGTALYEDLVQEGLLAVVQAARTWRADGGASFLTYATNNIRRRMQRRLGRSPVVCRSNRDREAGIYELPSTVSLDAPVGDGDRSLYETAGDERLAFAASQEEAVAALERVAIVRKVIATLPERDAGIIAAVMEGTDYRSVGREFGCSSSRVEQLVKKWTPILRRRLAKELAHDDR